MCDSVSDKTVNGEGSQAILETSEEGEYLATALVAAGVLLAAVLVAAVVAGGVVGFKHV